MARDITKPFGPLSTNQEDEDALLYAQKMPPQQPDFTDQDKRSQLQYELQNTSQANTYPGLNWPFNRKPNEPMYYDATNMNDANSPTSKFDQARQLDHDMLYADPYRFARLKQLLGK